MSRIAKNPVVVPEKVEVNIVAGAITIKGPLGELKQDLTGDVEIKKEDTTLTFEAKRTTKFAKAMSGTIR
jgi:large subunit ribosomal protein L6